MTSTHRLQSNQSAILLAGILGLALGLGFGCNDQPETCKGANTTVDREGECVCKTDYEPCDPDDPANPNCCEVLTMLTPCASGDNNMLDPSGTGDCICLPGYEWCNPDDVNDLDCCAVAMDAGTDDVGTTG